MNAVLLLFWNNPNTLKLVYIESDCILLQTWVTSSGRSVCVCVCVCMFQWLLIILCIRYQMMRCVPVLLKSFYFLEINGWEIEIIFFVQTQNFYCLHQHYCIVSVCVCVCVFFQLCTSCFIDV